MNIIKENKEKDIENYNINSQSESDKYKKNILNNLDNIAIAKYYINPKIPLDPIFYDILCINCHECVKPDEVDIHSEYCIIQNEKGKKKL